MPTLSELQTAAGIEYRMIEKQSFPQYAWIKIGSIIAENQNLLDAITEGEVTDPFELEKAAKVLRELREARKGQ